MPWPMSEAYRCDVCGGFVAGEPDHRFDYHFEDHFEDQFGANMDVCGACASFLAPKITEALSEVRDERDKQDRKARQRQQPE